MTRLLAAVLAFGLCLALGGCGDDPAPGPDAGWTPAAAPVDRHGLVYERGGIVRLGDGTTVVTEAGARYWVVAGDGVYFVSAGDGTTGPISLATPDGVEETGAEAEGRSLTASPDGRYLAFLDMTTGEEDGFGTPVATAVVVDLDAGEEVVRTTEGMGDPDSDDDLRDLYEDAGLGIVGLTDDAAYVDTPDGLYEYSLPDGDGRRLPDDTDVASQPWYVDPFSTPPSPSGAWSVAQKLDGRTLLVPADGGPPVPLRGVGESVGVLGWLDDETVLAATDGADGEPALLTCPTSNGRCTTVPGTEDGVTLPVGGLLLP